MSLWNWIGRSATALLLGVGLSPGAFAQIAQSPNYQLDGIALDASGGGACSVGGVAYTSLGDLSGGPLASTNFGAGVGFLEAFDPDLPAGLVIFGISPNFGPTSGGTTVTVSGFNFDKLGAGPTTQVFVGGLPASNVNVASNTMLTFTSPPGLAGSRMVLIVNTQGAAFKADGFIYVPAITTTPVVLLPGDLEIRNYGAFGDAYTTFVSTSTCAIPAPPYGTLLIGPFPFIQLILPTAYDGPDGVSLVTISLPNLPILSGLVVHFQSVSIPASGPVPGILTNATTTSIL